MASIKLFAIPGGNTQTMRLAGGARATMSEHDDPTIPTPPAHLEMTEIRYGNFLLLLNGYGGPKKMEAAARAVDPRTKLTSNYLSQLKNKKSNIGPRTARNLETIAKKAKGWMDHVHFVHFDNEITGPRRFPSTSSIGVPLLASQDVAPWPQVGAALARSGTRLIEVNEQPPIGAHAYAWEVDGDAMVSDTMPSFPRGTTVIVDPSLPLVHNAFAIFRGNDGTVTFRLFRADGGRFLYALRSGFPYVELTPSLQYCGRVIGIAEKRLYSDQ